ncbi:amidohydrolase [Clostridioides difficile]|nr:hypothetical protein KW95_15040 [Clostridioides difficile]
MYYNFERIDEVEFKKELIKVRRDLHKYPESAWTEYRTTVKIIEMFEELKIPYMYGTEIHSPEHMLGKPDIDIQEECIKRAIKETGREDLINKIAGGFTGVVGIIEGEQAGPTVAIRFDIDCNDLIESDEPGHVPVKEGFNSEHHGCMHACGHDAHTAIGFGTAKILSKYKDKIKGKVMLIFQPAEEGGRGAISLVEKGILHEVDYIFGGHIANVTGNLGAIAAGSYGYLVSSKFDVCFEGKSAHAGNCPEVGHNALAAAATATLNMLAIPRTGKGASRINIGVLQAGTGRNVIPDNAILKAETRGITNEINEYMLESAIRVCESSALMYKCKYSLNFKGKSADSYCDKDFVGFVAKSGKCIDGIKEIVDYADLGAGEDFTFMMNDVHKHGGKATYLLLDAELTEKHHNRNFDYNEDIIPISAMLYSKVVLDISSNY